MGLGCAEQYMHMQGISAGWRFWLMLHRRRDGEPRETFTLIRTEANERWLDAYMMLRCLGFIRIHEDALPAFVKITSGQMPSSQGADGRPEGRAPCGQAVCFGRLERSS